MKQLLVCPLLIAGSAFLSFAQPPKPLTKNPASPAMESTVTIEGKKIGVWYHAPSVKGRHIFGGADAMQPDDTVWRAGANEATWFHTDAPLEMKGLTVPPGDYTLYVWLDKGKWDLIINKKTGQWGINRDGSTTDVKADELGRVPMTMSHPATVEQEKITLTDRGGNKGKLEIAWANMAGTVDFTVK
jgi:Protein of unknown function (DUF2911)